MTKPSHMIPISFFQGRVVYDEKFSKAFSPRGFDAQALRDLCKLCKIIANNTELVKAGGSQCLPHYGKLHLTCLWGWNVGNTGKYNTSIF